MRSPASYRRTHRAALDEIERFWKDPAKYEVPAPLPTPPGQPIGSADEDEFEVN